MTKLHIEQLDLNTKKSFSTILEFSNFGGSKGGNTEFQKIWIFEHNSALNYSMVKKFHTRRLDFNIKNPFSMIF